MLIVNCKYIVLIIFDHNMLNNKQIFKKKCFKQIFKDFINVFRILFRCYLCDQKIFW